MNISMSFAQSLAARIGSGDATIGVIGLGYVGAPLSFAFWRAGFKVVGFDISAERVAALTAGEHVINYLSPELFAEAAASTTFDATTDFSRLAEADAIVICVPTPLTRHNEPDLSFIRATGEAIAPHLRRGQTVILESTTWPGTTRQVLKPILDRSGLVCGKDYFLAFSPEREDPGNPNFHTASIPKVVGADDDGSRAIACAVYAKAIDRIVPVSSSAAAEAVKLTENIFRAVNIALVNELKTIYGAMNVDIWEVVDAAATKPFGFMPFYPGPGLGGHCIPIDPFYLTWKARECGVETRFIELAGAVNTRMPRLVVDKVASALDKRGVAMHDARVLICGLAYKKNINDIRESPALVVMELIEERGAACDYVDPFAPRIPNTREHPDLAGRISAVLSPGKIAAYDAVVLVTDHDDLPYEELAANARLIVDTRNAFTRRGLSGDHIVKA